MYTMPAPTVRLLLLKSGAGSGAKIAHQGGYALYGNPPRWRKITADKPAPKGAPVAAHPKAAGHHEPAAHFTDDQWAALKLPDSNVNASTFNGALAKLKAWSDAGDVTAILGSGYGVNTYGQRLVKLANHLLGLHGSPHKVVAGQKAGTHAATLNADPAAPHPSGLPDHIAPKVAEPVDPGFSTPPVSHYQVDPQQYGSWAFIKPGVGKSFTHEDKQVLIAWFKSTGWYANITEDGRVFVKPKSGASLEDIPVSPNQAAKLKKDKDKFEAEKKAKAEKAASDSALNSTDQFSYVEQSLGGNANAYTKKALAKYLIDGGKFDGIYGGWINHLKLAGIDVGDGSPKAAAAGLKAAYQNSVVGAAGSSTSKPTEAAHAEGDKWVMPLDAAVAEHKELVAAAESPSKADDKAVLAEQKAELGKLEAAQAGGGAPAVAPEPVVPTAQPAPSPRLVLPKKASAVPEPAKPKLPPHLVSLVAKMSGPQPGATVTDVTPAGYGPEPGPKEGDTKPAADGGTLVLKDGHWVKQGGDAAPVAQATQAAPAAQAPTPPTGPLTAEQLANLQSIPWYKLKLPDSNSNAKSHNAAVAKIEAMAFAGDVAGLKAFADKKAGAKQTYAKKQHLLAMSALDFLSGSGPTTEQKVRAAKVAAQPEPVVEAAQAVEPAAAPAPVTADTPLTDGQLLALESFSLDELKALDGGPSPPNVQAWVGKKLSEMEPPATTDTDTGPKEGDTKQGADGMLVLKNGRWVKVEGDKPNAKAIVATVPMPKLGGGNGKIKFTQKMKELKAIAEQEGAAGLSKVVSFSPSGHVKIKGYKSINPNGSVYGKNAEAMAQYAKALHEAVVGAGAVGTPAAAPAPGTPTPAPATPTPPPTVNGLPSMDNWVQTGQQGGSNPGGKFKDPSGQEWYCKWPDDAEAAKSEVLAAKLYALAGLSAQDCMLVSKGGKTAIATKWVNIQKAPSPSALAAADGALAGFAVDAWLGNWDVVGLAFDNLQIGPDGKAHRVDAGGSLEYRAQGEKKPFGPKVDELETLRDAGKNAQAAAVFKGMTKADMTASAAKVLAISDVAIRAMVNQYGPGDAAAKAKLAETLIARKKDIAAKFPEAAKKKKAPTFKPEDISAPPSFLNWGGSGKSGPSSKEFLNKANEDAVQAIFAAAKTGDVEAVKKLTAPVFDKGTGAVTGQQSVLYHPSQHVSGYAQQAINEINYQLNPPKQFRFDGGHPLHSLNAAYPSHKGAPSSAAAQKLGKFIALGEPGVIALADLALPAKITHAEGGGTLSVHTYAKQAQAAIAKMPATQKQAVKSYTGNSYHAMNGSLWDGNPTGAAKAAGEALHTLGHDIEPGTILSRHLSLHGKDLNDILGSVGKVLQEPAIMSTSIRPSSWIRNVQFKLHVGPGVKGLWVGYNSLPGGEALSKNAGEDEMVLPPGTRLLVLNVRKGGKDADGFGAHGQQHVIEAIILPTE